MRAQPNDSHARSRLGPAAYQSARTLSIVTRHSFRTDHTDRRCYATTDVFASARARRISTTPTTRNHINGGKFAMMAGPQPPAL